MFKVPKQDAFFFQPVLHMFIEKGAKGHSGRSGLPYLTKDYGRRRISIKFAKVDQKILQEKVADVD